MYIINVYNICAIINAQRRSAGHLTSQHHRQNYKDPNFIMRHMTY